MPISFLVAYPFRMSQRPLSFDVERHDAKEAVLAVSGEIDLSTAPELEKIALRLLEERPRRLVLDFSEVPFCDSTGIGVLVRLYNRASATGCRLTIRKPTPNVRAVLEMTALTRIFQIDDGV
jgi:anti-sigma B factor antagonist